MRYSGTVLVSFWHWWLLASLQPGCCLTSARSKKLVRHPTTRCASQQNGKDAPTSGCLPDPEQAFEALDRSARVVVREVP